MIVSLQTTTAFSLHGYQVTEERGVVRGIIVRSRSVVGSIGASLQTLIGGNITIFTSLCEQTRRDAFDLMVAHAKELGANAVIGVRYDATEVAQGVTEVLCYGTAVVVKKVMPEEERNDILGTLTRGDAEPGGAGNRHRAGT